MTPADPFTMADHRYRTAQRGGFGKSIGFQNMARPVSFFIREGLSLAALVVAGLAMFIIITGVLP